MSDFARKMLLAILCGAAAGIASTAVAFVIAHGAEERELALLESLGAERRRRPPVWPAPERTG